MSTYILQPPYGHMQKRRKKNEVEIHSFNNQGKRKNTCLDIIQNRPQEEEEAEKRGKVVYILHIESLNTLILYCVAL